MRKALEKKNYGCIQVFLVSEVQEYYYTKNNIYYLNIYVGSKNDVNGNFN